MDLLTLSEYGRITLQEERFSFRKQNPVCRSLKMHFTKPNYASFKLLLRLWCKDRLET